MFTATRRHRVKGSKNSSNLRQHRAVMQALEERKLLSLGTVEATYAGFGPGVTPVDLDTPVDGLGSAGIIAMNRTGGSWPGLPPTGPFTVICAELTQDFGFGTTYDVEPLGSSRADNGLKELYGAFRSSVVDSTTGGAFQIAAWEIMSEPDSNAWDVTSGVFTVNPVQNPGVAAAIAQATTWLNDLAANTYPMANLFKLVNGTFQDLLVEVPGTPGPNDAGLGDFVWEDSNANGLQEVGEPGIDGVTVELRDSGNNVLATTTTGDNPNLPGTQHGYYEFTGLTPGVQYHVVFGTPAGYTVTTRHVGSGGNAGSVLGNQPAPAKPAPAQK